MPKHHVLTVKLTCHIPVNPGSPDSVKHAALQAKGLQLCGSTVGETTVDWRLARVPAPEPAQPEPEPEPAADEAHDESLDIPDNLRRTAEPEAAE